MNLELNQCIGTETGISKRDSNQNWIKNPTGGTIPNLKSNTLVYYLSPLPPGGFSQGVKKKGSRTEQKQPRKDKN